MLLMGILFHFTPIQCETIIPSLLKSIRLPWVGLVLN